MFLPSGAFRVLPPLPEAALREALRHKVLDFLCSEGVLDTGVLVLSRLDAFLSIEGWL